MATEAKSSEYDNKDLVTALTSFREKDYENTLILLEKFITEHKAKAGEEQKSLREYPWESKEKIMSYAALNDISLAMLIKGVALQNSGKDHEARETYSQLIDRFYYGQCLCSQGSYEKPAVPAQVRLTEDGWGF